VVEAVEVAADLVSGRKEATHQLLIPTLQEQLLAVLIQKVVAAAGTIIFSIVATRRSAIQVVSL